MRLPRFHIRTLRVTVAVAGIVLALVPAYVLTMFVVPAQCALLIRMIGAVMAVPRRVLS